MPLSPDKTYACPVQLTLDVVGGKWKPLILWLLRKGPRRYNDLLKAMPVTHKVLTQQLRQLERDGLAVRLAAGAAPMRIGYRLTAFGETLRPVMNEMAAWAKRHHGRLGRGHLPARYGGDIRSTHTLGLCAYPPVTAGAWLPISHVGNIRGEI